MVLAVGTISYEKHSRRVLTHYFDKHNVDYHFITEAPAGLDTRNSHPSWWKLLAHRMCPGYDFIICWDLDLLPRTPSVSVFQSFDMAKLCLAWDSHALHHPNDRFLPSFKYNGGLIGYPAGARGFLEGVFEKYAPGTYPSYEQYYLNGEIASNQYEIHELDKDINVLFSFSEFPQARLQHYTYTNDAKQHIQSHADRYFSTND